MTQESLLDLIGAPVSSSHERYVWRTVCQPISASFDELTVKAEALDASGSPAEALVS